MNKFDYLYSKSFVHVHCSLIINYFVFNFFIFKILFELFFKIPGQSQIKSLPETLDRKIYIGIWPCLSVPRLF